MPRNERTQFRMLYTKNSYSNRTVKVRNWERINESLPIDINPYCAGAVNHFLSHYKRLGSSNDDNVDDYATTTTADMLRQNKRAETVPSDRHLINVYTFDDQNGGVNDGFLKDATICAPDYLTTMQHSYAPPVPYKMQRLHMDKTPFLKYRKFKQQDPIFSDYKFYDDDYHCKTHQLQQHKMSSHSGEKPDMMNYYYY